MLLWSSCCCLADISTSLLGLCYCLASLLVMRLAGVSQDLISCSSRSLLEIAVFAGGGAQALSDFVPPPPRGPPRQSCTRSTKALARYTTFEASRTCPGGRYRRPHVAIQPQKTTTLPTPIPRARLFSAEPTAHTLTRAATAVLRRPSTGETTR